MHSCVVYNRTLQLTVLNHEKSLLHITLLHACLLISQYNLGIVFYTN